MEGVLLICILETLMQPIVNSFRNSHFLPWGRLWVDRVYLPLKEVSYWESVSLDTVEMILWVG
jgi:hypothetical protein